MLALRMVLALVLLTAVTVSSPVSEARAQNHHTTPSDGRIERPLFVIEDRLIVPVDIVGVGEQFFILDTAASSSVISARLREQLEIDPPRVRRDTVQGAGGQHVMEKVLFPGIANGGETFTDVDPVVLDFSEFREYDGRLVEGILGTDVLRHYDVEIDAAGEALRLLPTDAVAAMEGGATEEEAAGLPFVSKSAPGFVELELVVSGRPVQAVLDTGAPTSVFNWHAAEAVGIAREDPALRKQERGGRGITGGRTEAHFYAFDDLRVGPAPLGSAEVKIADLPVFEVLGVADGPAMLVGLDAVRACRVTIDYSTSRLHICN